MSLAFATQVSVSGTRTARDPHPSQLPAVYSVKLATDAQEFRAALRLRYEVFNVELREGLESSKRTGCDFDAFDAVMDHIIVKCAYSRRVVGTYRVQTGTTAARHLGYYGEREFDFMPYDALRCQLVELGRACIHQDHRNANVLMLLWKAVAQYAIARGCRYLIGCSSVTSQDPTVGAGVYAKIKNSLTHPELRTMAHPRYRCELTSEDSATKDPKIPKLLRAYLSVGAQICGAPALDAEFGTIDFLTLLDLGRVPKGMLARTTSKLASASPAVASGPFTSLASF